VKPRIGPLDVLFYLILVAIVFMLVRPGGQGGKAVLAIAGAFAAAVRTAVGAPGTGVTTGATAATTGGTGGGNILAQAAGVSNIQSPLAENYISDTLKGAEIIAGDIKSGLGAAAKKALEQLIGGI
jgi:drug/metabolite transporter (DMT)-like permease